MTTTNRTELDKVRARIAERRTERERVAEKPRTRDEALEALEAWITSEAAKLEPDAGAFIHGRPRATLTHQDFGSGRATFTPALCLLGPDRIRDAFAAEIENELADTEPLAAQDQAARLAELDAEILDLERNEESLVVALHEAGEPVERRADADPRAVLGLDTPPTRPAA